jgi:hypothetical protein
VRTLSDNFANTNGVGVSSNGERGRSNNFELDGQTNNDNSVTGPQVFFRNEDALAEVQVITNNFSAQYGRNVGSVVNYITKSGTNSIHGTAFENYVGSWGSSLTQGQKSPLLGFCNPSAPATGCIPVIVPRVTANEYGGTLGFPIWKDKLWGFGGTLFRRVTNGASASTTTTPTPTQTGPSSVKAGNPQPIASTISTITVCAQAVSACPAGTGAAIQVAGISRKLPSTSSDQEDLGRIDFQVTPRDRYFLRYFYQKAPTFVSGGTITTGSYYDTHDIADAHVLAEVDQPTALRVSTDDGAVRCGRLSDLRGCDDRKLPRQRLYQWTARIWTSDEHPAGSGSQGKPGSGQRELEPGTAFDHLRR